MEDGRHAIYFELPRSAFGSYYTVQYPYTKENGQIDKHAYDKIDGSYVKCLHPDDHARAIIKVFKDHIIDHVVAIGVAKKPDE